jgi:hypothetical protein
MELPQVATTYDLVRTLYKNDWGDPFELTPTQNDIFNCIFQKQSPDGKRRIHIETFTQFGKSDTVSMAVLTRVATFPEKWVITAPSAAKAKIIMGDIIKHAFENEYTMERLKLEDGESMEMLRRERSKNRLTFNVGNNSVGEVFIVSAESKVKRQEDIGNSLMGFGAPNLVMDEAALLDDAIDAKAMRMVGGFAAAGLDFVVKIGNPFRRNHFLDSYKDPAYFKIVADYKLGLKEGRLTESFIEEMKKKPFFRVLYDCKFPESNEIDDRGWSQLISEEDIDRARIKEGDEIQHVGEKRLGNDVARGGLNFTTWVIRSMNYASIKAKSQQDNLIEIGAQTALFMKDDQIAEYNTFVDGVAVGGGVVDSLKSGDLNIRDVNVGRVATDEARFSNLRAEAYWNLREWIKKGGRLSDSDDWYQLCDIKYKPDNRGRIKVMSKDEMRSMGIDSPDVADALMLTFTRGSRGMTEAMKKRKQKRNAKRGINKGVKVRMGGY